MDSPCASEKSYIIVIKAEDAGVPFKLHSNTTVTLNIKYKNEYPPFYAVPSATKIIPEDVAIGTFIHQATATDADCGSDGKVTYSITGGNTGSVFAIDATSGNITTVKTLDREDLGSYKLSIQAKDEAASGSKTAVLSVLVSLSDVNDNKPTFSKASFTETVNEDAATSAQVADVKATDLDSGANGQLTYSIKSGNDDGYFVIEQGIIKVAKSLDLETQSHSANLSYRLEVFVEDKGTPSLNNTVFVDITVSSVNEFSPTVESSATVEVSEDDPVGKFVYDVNATDADYGVDGQVRFSIKTGNERDEFTIDSVTGEWVVMIFMISITKLE